MTGIFFNWNIRYKYTLTMNQILAVQKKYNEISVL